MRRSTFLFILLLPLLCCEVKSNTLEFPRENRGRIEDIGDTVPGSRFFVTAARPADGKRAAELLGHLSHVWDLLLAKFVRNANIEPASHRHRVILYGNRREYVARLFSIEPNIARTNGFYHAPGKTAHFFSTESKILFHEGTHQILAERFFHDKRSAFRNNFWVVEGMALFMESLKIEDDRYKVGDILADRLYSAKVYRFERDHHLPIRKLTAMGAAEIQSRRADLQQIYSQSAALTHWLMFAEEGRYRTALFELLGKPTTIWQRRRR